MLECGLSIRVCDVRDRCLSDAPDIRPQLFLRFDCQKRHLIDWATLTTEAVLQANEDYLWTLFSPIGQVLELYVLRNNNAKSRGCAFVTYASKQLAEQAITQLNGRPMSSGKTLVVKFADRASANKANMGSLLDLCIQ